jgi:hypothetical protein
MEHADPRGRHKQKEGQFSRWCDLPDGTKPTDCEGELLLKVRWCEFAESKSVLLKQLACRQPSYIAET